MSLLHTGTRQLAAPPAYYGPVPPDEVYYYTRLGEAELRQELARQSLAQARLPLGLDRGGDTDVVSLQPCPNPEQYTQDRWVVQDWELPGLGGAGVGGGVDTGKGGGGGGGTWKLRGVMDGHAGHETADHVVRVLPPLIKSLLAELLASASPTTDDPADPADPANPADLADAVSALLIKAIKDLDDALAADVFALVSDVLGGGLEGMGDEEIRWRVNDFGEGGEANAKVLRCMRGTTVLVSLTDPGCENVWVASLGDCQAVLTVKHASTAHANTTDTSNDDDTDDIGFVDVVVEEGVVEEEDEDGSRWTTTLMSANHNGTEADEVARMQAEHPGEEDCILNSRVLGAIAVTRAVGDHEFKLPRIWTDRVFLNCHPGFKTSQPISNWLARNRTPPYVSNVADVRHVRLGAYKSRGVGGADAGAGRFEAYILMCSDGLTDLYDMEGMRSTPGEFDTRAVMEECARKVRRAVREGKEEEEDNLALHVLRDALGGEDEEKVSKMLTVEMTGRWMDDTTVLVQRLG